MRGFLRVLLFVVAGPIAGLLAMSVIIGTWTLVTSGRTSDYTFGPELFAPGILIVTYSVGGIPALLTGIASIFVARWRGGWIGWLITALIGGVISFVIMLAVFGVPQFSGTNSDSMLSLLVALAGAAAGLVGAALFDGLSTLLRRKAA